MHYEFKDEAAVVTEKKTYTLFESVYAWLCVLVGYLFCRAFPAGQYPLGFFLVSLVCISSAFFVLAKRGISFRLSSILCAAASMLFAFCRVMTEDALAGFLAFICSLLFYCFFIYTSSGGFVGATGRDILPLELLRALKSANPLNLGDMFSAMFARKSKGLKSLLKIFIGLCAAFIPTLIVIALLSYDGEFSRIMAEIFRWLSHINIFSHIFSLLFGLVVAMYLYGVYAVNSEKRKEIDYDKYVSTSKKIQIAPALSVAAAVLPMLAVYVIFFISQRYYYISAFTNKLPDGVQSYAEYARSGFFELCTVSAINLVVLITVALLLRRVNKAESVFFKVISVTVSVMTLVLIGTAMAKMMLYIDQYGLTQKRVLSSWFMVLLAFVFILIILRQFISKLKLVSACVATIIAMTALLGLSNYKTIIADYNVERYISGESSDIDAIALADLGSSAVPAMTRLADYWNAQFVTPEYYGHEYIIDSLRINKIKLATKEGIFEFSIPDARARRALDSYYEKYPHYYE